jgi:hypothetical protein
VVEEEASPACRRKALVVAGSAAEEVSELIVLSGDDGEPETDTDTHHDQGPAPRRGEHVADARGDSCSPTPDPDQRPVWVVWRSRASVSLEVGTAYACCGSIPGSDARLHAARCPTPRHGTINRAIGFDPAGAAVMVWRGRGS